MNPIARRVIKRLLVVAAVIVLPVLIMSVPEINPATLNGQDGLLFFLSAAVFAAILPRACRFFTAPVISSSQIFSLAMSGLACGFVVSTMSSVHWRGAGHIASLNDGASRVLFRHFYILYAASGLLTAGDYEPDVFRSPAMGRWRMLAVVAAVSLGLLAALSYSDRLTVWLWTRQDMHDTAPLAPDTNGVP